MALVTPTSTAVSYGAGDYLSDDDTTMMLYEQGYEVCRIPTPQRGVRMHTPSPSRRTNSFRASPGRRATPSPTGRKKNRLMTPIRALSFRRKKKNLVPPGPDSEAASIIRVSSVKNSDDHLLKQLLFLQDDKTQSVPLLKYFFS
jgi:hypothetical protein